MYEIQKEADKKSILTMKELVENLTKNKLQLTTDISALKDRIVGLQKSNKELEKNKSLQQVQLPDSKAFQELQKKCDRYKVENIAQSEKIKRIKNRLLEVSRKLTKLKESKVALMTIQNEYASSITKWQGEILKASNLLYTHIDKIENDRKVLENKLGSSANIRHCLPYMVDLCETAIREVNGYKKEIKRQHEIIVFEENPKTTENLYVSKLEALDKEFKELNDKSRNVLKEKAKSTKELQYIYECVPHLIELCNKAVFEYNNFSKETKVSSSNDKTLACSAEKDLRMVDLLAEMRELNEILKKRGDVISRQEEKIHELENKINEMEKEEFQKSDLQSEILSNSTISRAEEISRLKEVDECLEEKYGKLRILASKLKKKCQDQAELLLKMDAKKTAKNIQALQIENDKLQDEIEILKKGNCSTVNLDFQKEKDSFDLIKNQIEIERDNLKIELDSKLKEIDKQKIELQKLNAAKKQSNVLSLEVEAYEKSLNEVSGRLSEKNSIVESLQNCIEKKDEQIQSLNKEIQHLVENIDGEKKHSQELKLKIDFQQKQLKAKEHDYSSLSKELKHLQSEYEKLNTEKCDLSLTISETTSQNQNVCFSLTKDKEQLIEQVVKLEETVEELKSNLTTIKINFDDMKDEYTSYKFKAQSVLRQNQTKESSRERELEDELVDIKTEKETLNIQLRVLSERLSASEKKVLELTTDYERVDKRCKELINMLEETREQNDLILTESKRQNELYKESLRSHMHQIDNLNVCYKVQIEELEKKHQAGLILARENLKGTSSLYPSQQSATKSVDEQKIDLLLMEREDAEGSESSVPIVPRRKMSQIQSRSKHDAIPLDQLLNSAVEFQDEIYAEDDQDLGSFRAKFLAQENQVKYLTSLLAETEQDLAKLSQQNSILKEEIRRNERAEEREKHMHNSEYLKNVVVKFITLSNGDERLRLVPVLNTILKLSREEYQTVENVAKGNSLDHGNRGWGNLLWKNS
ncbi:GCC2 family protein [Megaselia abdita]